LISPLLRLLTAVPEDIHPHASAWTTENDQSLKNLRHQLGGNWDEIANEIGRSSGACKQRWTKLNKRDKERDIRYQYDVQEEYAVIFLFGKKGLKPAAVEKHFLSLFLPGEER